MCDYTRRAELFRNRTILYYKYRYIYYSIFFIIIICTSIHATNCFRSIFIRSILLCGIVYYYKFITLCTGLFKINNPMLCT